MADKDYYQILQVDPSAEPEVIAAAYKRLSLKYHPDKNPSPQATLRMQEINEAYRVLSDPALRARYDQELANNRGRGAYRRSRGTYGQETSSDQVNNQGESRHPPGQWVRQARISTAFTITYLLAIFLLFRVVRPYNLVLTLAVIVLAGVIAYYVSARIDKALQEKK